MVTHATLVEKFGDSPAIKLAKRTKNPIVCLNYIDDEWVLTWTTGSEKEVITIHNVKSLKLEPLYEETIHYAGMGDKHRRNFRSEGGTAFDPDTCPVCYDGLSFEIFSHIDVNLGKIEANFYFNWDLVGRGTTFTFYNDLH